MRGIWRIAIGVVAALALVEVAARIAGAESLPIYIKDPVDNYRPAPNQQGALWHRNDWVYNDLGMGVANPFGRVGILIVGDSETEGSVSFMRQADKIGPLLSAATGSVVWPMGAKGWGLANELAWINSHPQVLSLKRIMILSNRGDFGPAEQWDDEITHPTHRPVIVTWFLLRKAFYHPAPLADDPTPTAHSTQIWHAALKQFLDNYSGQVIFVELPVRNDVLNHLDGFSPLNDELTIEHRANVHVIGVADDPAWNASLYKNNYHPSAAGNRELAAYIGQYLRAMN